MKITTKRLVSLSLVAAIYVVSTLAIAPLSYGPVQFRISEILNLLAFINPVYGIAVTLGCFIANLFTMNIFDIVFGTLATAISVFFIGKSKNLILASFYPTIFNAIIVGWVIVGAYITGDMLFFLNNPEVVDEVTLTTTSANVTYIMTALSVGAGEFAVCTVLGVPLVKYLQSKQQALYQMLKDI